MRLEVIGINHTTSKVEVREKAAINSESLSSQLPLLTAGEEMEGAVILSTCNRTEFYLSPRTHLHKDSLRALFTRITNLDSTETANAYLFQDEAAVQHLFKVASGLNSQIVGETEILGQVKDAYYQALKLEQTNTVLNKVFLRAIECGKEVRHRTAITEGAVSVASAAAQLAGKIFGQLQAHNTLLVGAGATAQLVATHLQSNGAVNWRVSNRTPARAEQLAALLNGAVTVFPPTAAELAWADLVVCATSAPHHLISREMVQAAARQRHTPRLFLDLAVPLDVESSVRELPETYHFSVDEIHQMVTGNLQARQKEAGRAEKIILRHTGEFTDWYQENRVAPTIIQLQSVLEGVRQEIYEENARRFCADDRQELAAFSRSLMRRVTSLFIANMKKASLNENDLSLARAITLALASDNQSDIEQIVEKLDNELSH